MHHSYLKLVAEYIRFYETLYLISGNLTIEDNIVEGTFKGWLACSLQQKIDWIFRGNRQQFFFGLTSIFSLSNFAVQLSTTEWMILLRTLLLCWLGMIDKRSTECCQTLINWRSTFTQSLMWLDVLRHFHNFLRCIGPSRNTFIIKIFMVFLNLSSENKTTRDTKNTKKCCVN